MKYKRGDIVVVKIGDERLNENEESRWWNVKFHHDDLYGMFGLIVCEIDSCINPYLYSGFVKQGADLFYKTGKKISKEPSNTLYFTETEVLNILSHSELGSNVGQSRPSNQDSSND